MTKVARLSGMLRDLGNKHETYHKAKKDYDKAKDAWEKENGKGNATYGVYSIVYDDTTSSATDWAGIAEALGITEKDAREAFTIKTPSKRFKGVTKNA